MAIILAILLSAADPCAWVMWQVGESLGRDKEPYARTVTARAAYDNYRECLKDVRAEAGRTAELGKLSRYTKRVRTVPQPGGSIKVIVESEGGGHTALLMCFPHPVKPE